ncbi:MAG TPA: Na+/H+ antiporter [Chloroflexia bacterium]|jgi:CPA1 family monovalent cation:H+ antiporter
MEHGSATADVATLVWLLIAVMAVAVITKYIRIPYTVALVIAGGIIAISPINLNVDLSPDLILVVFLPALLFEAAYHLHFMEVRDTLRPIALLAVPGVLLTALSVASILFYVAGLSWQTAFLFGAIISATDPVSVLAIFRQLGAPRRLSVILEGESLFNDGTSLVIFRIILAGAIAQAAGDALFTVQEFLFVVLGGLLLGALAGFLASRLLLHVDDYLVETTGTLVLAYGTYLLAERVGVSGVIAVVVAGLVFGNYGQSVAMSPTTRAAVAASWEFFGFLANSLIFLLIGLEVNLADLGRFWAPTLLAILAVLLVRTLVVAVASWILRHIHRPIPFRWQTVLIWGGLRGSLALAMSLSIPFAIAPNTPFPDRDLILAMTFGVILFSLLVQGLTMGALLNRLGLTGAPAIPPE